MIFFNDFILQINGMCLADTGYKKGYVAVYLLCDCREHFQIDLRYAAFHLTDVPDRDRKRFGKLLLRHATRFSTLLDAPADQFVIHMHCYHLVLILRVIAANMKIVITIIIVIDIDFYINFHYN